MAVQSRLGGSSQTACPRSGCAVWAVEWRGSAFLVGVAVLLWWQQALLAEHACVCTRQSRFTKPWGPGDPGGGWAGIILVPFGRFRKSGCEESVYRALSHGEERLTRSRDSRPFGWPAVPTVFTQGHQWKHLGGAVGPASDVPAGRPAAHRGVSVASRLLRGPASHLWFPWEAGLHLCRSWVQRSCRTGLPAAGRSLCSWSPCPMVATRTPGTPRPRPHPLPAPRTCSPAVRAHRLCVSPRRVQGRQEEGLCSPSPLEQHLAQSRCSLNSRGPDCRG